MLSQLVSVILALGALKKTYPDGLHTGHHAKMQDIFEMLSIGFPLALQSILFPVANSIIQAAINRMGTDVIAAWAVCGKLDMLIWFVSDTMSPALSTYTAQNLGAGKKDRVVKGNMTGMLFSVGTVAVLSLILFFFPGPLGNLFITAQDVPVLSPMIVHFMRIMAPFYVFYAVAEAFSGACCGMGDTVRPMIVTLLCTCGLRVAAIFFILPLFGTMDCIVWIYVASWIVTGLAFTFMFLAKSKKLKTA